MPSPRDSNCDGRCRRPPRGGAAWSSPRSQFVFNVTHRKAVKRLPPPICYGAETTANFALASAGDCRNRLVLEDRSYIENERDTKSFESRRPRLGPEVSLTADFLDMYRYIEREDSWWRFHPS